MVRKARYLVGAAGLLTLYVIAQNIHIEVKSPRKPTKRDGRKPVHEQRNINQHSHDTIKFPNKVNEEHHEPEPTPKALQTEVVTTAHASSDSKITFYEGRECKGTSMVMTRSQMHDQCPDSSHEGCLNLCSAKFEPTGATLKTAYKSVKLEGEPELDLYEDCGGSRYWGSVFKLDGCVNIYDWPPTSFIGFAKTAQLSISRETHKPTPGEYKYRIVYSAESSIYFSYQAQASYWGFMKSKQDGGGWTRLITSSIMDDMSTTFPTFGAKRCPYSRRYGPLNKADVLTKWYASVDRPTEDVIVVVDPDNWMTKSIRPWVDKVKPGHALGQEAWYAGARTSINRVWQKFCLKNCDFHLDLTAVPYFVHKDDLEVIAPLWKYYSLKIKEWLEMEPDKERMYGGLQIGWCTEMYGYNFAAAHAGVVHEVIPQLQLRDVGPHVSDEQWNKIPMIHMGRAWFPKSYGCKGWCHTEGRGLSGGRGDQVWCKCNVTGKDVIPWPLPDGMDHVSDTTLRYLHDSREHFGEIPESPDRPGGYHNAHP